MEPLVSNAADEQQVAAAEKTQKQRDRRSAALLRQQLSTPDGREFVWELLQDLGIYSDAVGSHEAVYRFLGRRAAGVKLLQRVTKFPKAFLEMQAEAMERDERRAEESRAARTPRATA